MTRQDLIDATEFYLLQVRTQTQVDVFPLETFKAQEHRACISWALDGGTIPAVLSQRRTEPKPTSVGRRTNTLEPYITDVIRGRPRPPPRTTASRAQIGK